MFDGDTLVVYDQFFLSLLNYNVLFYHRCISDHGREARFPFLDENVVRFLQSLPVCVKVRVYLNHFSIQLFCCRITLCSFQCDPRLPRGIGEKILLREIASQYLQLKQTSKYPKRAIQFGSRIAKLESNKEKGSEQCSRLKQK